MRPYFFFDSFDWNSLLLNHWVAMATTVAFVLVSALAVAAYDIFTAVDRWLKWRSLATLKARQRRRASWLYLKVKQTLRERNLRAN